MTLYTDKELKREAVLAIRRDAKAANAKARCLGYSIQITEPSTIRLVAHGQRTDDSEGYQFDVCIAI